MHDIAPKTTPSDRAANSGHKRPTRPKQATLEQSPAPPAPATATTYQAPREPAIAHRVAPIADLDEGDVLLHVLGTGLGPVFCAFVCELALRLHLRGWARCESGALTLRAVGHESELAALVHEIRIHAPADCSVRAIEPDAGDGGAPLPEHGFVPIVADFGCPALATGTSAAAGPDW